MPTDTVWMTMQELADMYNVFGYYVRMVVMSIEQYSALTDEVELKLDEADRMADSTDVRYSGDEVFKRVRGRIHGRKAL